VLVDDYQKEALKTADYPSRGSNMVYPALGLAGEAGEVADKAKKFWRDYNTMNSADLTAGQKDAIIKEMGDCSWYLAALANELGISLSYVFEKNIDKLKDRVVRGVIHGEGDNR
jgi:NTP pyrophosphatase (non-canonical NTP hydrolase)